MRFASGILSERAFIGLNGRERDRRELLFDWIILHSDSDQILLIFEEMQVSPLTHHAVHYEANHLVDIDRGEIVQNVANRRRTVDEPQIAFTSGRREEAAALLLVLAQSSDDVRPVHSLEIVFQNDQRAQAAVGQRDVTAVVSVAGTIRERASKAPLADLCTVVGIDLVRVDVFDQLLSAPGAHLVERVE